MDKYIYDESNGLWYELQGEYYIPCLILRYLNGYRRATYIILLTSGRQAQEHMKRLTEQMKRAHSITEQLKAENALEWVRRIAYGRVQRRL